MDARRRLRAALLLAALCLVATGCGTAGRCLRQPLEVMPRPVTLSQVEGSVGVVTTCLLPGVRCERGTAFPIGGGHWLTAASTGRSRGLSVIPGSPASPMVTVITGGHRYPATPVRVTQPQGYALLDVPGTAGGPGLPLATSSPRPLDAATVVCAEAARTVTYSGSLFLTTPAASDVNYFEVNSHGTSAECRGGPVLDRGVVVGLQLFGVAGAAWAARTSALRLPSTPSPSCHA